MNLLVVVRTVDSRDGAAGFLVRWLVEFAQHVGTLHIICLEKGEASALPSNCVVHSLGKERGKNRIREFFLFHYFALRLIPTVDGVYTHQNPEYAILAAPWCFAFRKKLIAWYAHGTLTWKTTLLKLVASMIVTSSPQGFRSPTRKLVVLHQGIDSDFFVPRSVRSNHAKRLLTVGRISRSKNIDLMIDLVADLMPDFPEVTLRIVGGTVLPEERRYLDELCAKVATLQLEGVVTFEGPVAYETLPPVYHSADVFLNFSGTGSMDKAVLEAMSCEISVLVTNEAYRDILPHIDERFFSSSNRAKLRDKTALLFKKPPTDEVRSRLRRYVQTEHELRSLVSDIVKLFTPSQL